MLKPNENNMLKIVQSDLFPMLNIKSQLCENIK